MSTKTTPQNFSEAMKKLNQINDWFEQEDLDLEEALGKLKEGKELITFCRGRLREIENEFIELRADMEETTDKATVSNSDSKDDLPF